MSAVPAEVPSFDVEAVRAQFPIFAERDIVFLDSAASAQRPTAVLDAMDDYYRRHHANVHRGVHVLSQEATQAFEDARKAVARFLNAPSEREVVWVRGTTEGINLFAYSWGGANLGPGKEVLLTELEHHSNIVPWQLVAQRTGATIRVARVHDDGSLDLDDVKAKLTERTAVFAFNHVSNSLGTVNPVKRLSDWAHAVGAVAMVDGAQGAVHELVDVQALGCDAYAFSGHKVYGPTGSGALWAKAELLEANAKVACLTDGVPPALHKSAMQLYAQGPDAYKEFTQNIVLVPNSITSPSSRPGTGALTSDQLDLCNQLGIKPAEFAAQQAARRAS